MPTLHFRLATASDFNRNLALLAPDRPLLDDQTWAALPLLIADLLERRRIQLVVIEDTETLRCRMLGGISFVDPDALTAAVADDSRSLLGALLHQVSRGRDPFLAPKHVAVENGRRNLRLFDFFGTPDFATAAGPAPDDQAIVYNAVDQAHRFFHWGYFLSEIWQEYTSPAALLYMQGLGFQLMRTAPLGGGGERNLFRANAADASQNPGALISHYFRATVPRFGFSLVEQDVLTAALLHQSDAEIAATLSIAPDALKKRWRSIYRRVETAEPGRLPRGSAAHLQRLTLVKLLQSRPEELRPYQPPATPSTE